MNFEIPESEDGEPIEVESPPGITASRGDDYYLEGRSIRFYHPPSAGAGVRLWLRGAPARGFRRKRPSSITIELSAWATGIADADGHLRTALPIALAELVELPNLSLRTENDPDIWIRFRCLRTWLQGFERSVREDRQLFAATATLQLEGELDLLVAKGRPAQSGIIDRILGRVTVLHETDPSSLRQPFAIRRVTRPLPAGARPIESVRLSALRDLNAAAAQAFGGLEPPITTLLQLALLDEKSASERLSTLTTLQVAEHRHAATLVLAFSETLTPQAAAVTHTLAELVAQDVSTLTDTLGRGRGYATQFRSDLLTLRLLLTSSAFDELTLADFIPK